MYFLMSIPPDRVLNKKECSAFATFPYYFPEFSSCEKVQN